MKFRIYIDEAGRGPLAGPVYTGLILPIGNFDIQEFHDSKTLNQKQRQSGYAQIKKLEQDGKIIYSYGLADNKEINKHGISRCLNLAICRGLWVLTNKYYDKILQKRLTQENNGYEVIKILQLRKLLNKRKPNRDVLAKIFGLIKELDSFQGIFIDGNKDFGLGKNLGVKTTTIVKGDSKSPYISMASIIAKEERDIIMQSLPKKYDKYGFEKHVGYGTKSHRQAIKKHGLSDLHRKLYCSNIIPYTRKKYNLNDDMTKNIEINPKNCKKPKLLLHICCGPDLTLPMMELKKHFELLLYWYNPNIDNSKEHRKRFIQFGKVLGHHKSGYKVVPMQYNDKDFYDYMYENQKELGYNESKQKLWQKLAKYEESGPRCELCYRLRLQSSAQMADKLGADFFTTTLFISPKKELDKLIKAGQKIESKSKFLIFDFKKNEGYKKSVQLSNKYGLYRQDYCGCIFSKK